MFAQLEEHFNNAAQISILDSCYLPPYNLSRQLKVRKSWSEAYLRDFKENKQQQKKLKINVNKNK